MDIIVKHHFKLVVFILLILGVGFFIYKHTQLGFPLMPTAQRSSWIIESRIQFTADNKPVKVTLTIPSHPLNYKILDQYFISKRYGVTTTQEGINKQVTFSIRRAKGPQELFYRVVIYKTGKGVSGTSLPAPTAPVALLNVSEQEQQAIDMILQHAHEKSADVQTLTAGLIKQLNAFDKTDHNLAFLVKNKKTTADLVEVARLILAKANIPSLTLNGMIIEQNKQPTFVPWLAVWDINKWVFINPITSEIGLPDNYFVWSYNDTVLLHVEGASKPKLQFTVDHDQNDELSLVRQELTNQKSKVLKLSLYNLPVQSQNLYKDILMLPIGVFVIVLLRNFAGIKTLGTFTPILIAMALRETDLIPGLIFFTTVVILGLGIRFYLAKFRILLVPRLASVLIIVILLMAFINIILENIGLDTSLSMTLFPIVIVTMIIERITIIWEENGAEQTIKQAVGSMIAAVLGYWVMQSELLRHIIFVFPELLLVLLACTLLIGKYKGYKLSELTRFKQLLKDESNV